MTDFPNDSLAAPGPWLRRAVQVADGAALAGGYAAMACLVAMTGLMLAQVAVAFASKFTHAIRGDIPVAWEYGSYLMGACFLLGSAVTLRAGRHIRLGVVIQSCGPRLLRVLEIVSSALALGFSVFLTHALIRGAERAAAMETTSISSGTPLWIPLAVFASGTALLALQFGTRLLCAFAGQPLVNDALRAGGELDE